MLAGGDSMLALSVDVGTSGRKAAIFSPEGEMLAQAQRPAQARADAQGSLWYDPDELYLGICQMIMGLPEGLRRSVGVMGITGMAEGGLLIDRQGRPCCAAMPWNTPLSRGAYEQYLQAAPDDRAAKTGLRASYKHSIFKILALGPAPGALWLGLPEYIAFRLSGSRAAVASLAARTYAYDIRQRAWDGAFLERLGLTPDIFPPLFAEGAPLGSLLAEAARLSGLPEGIPVTVGGHDHLCALYGAGADRQGDVLISAGTAQAVLGPLDSLAGMDPDSGLSYGPHILPGRYVWMGGLQAAGGSLNWITGLLYPESGHEGVLAAAQGILSGPGDLLYYPFLNGLSALRPEPAGAFFGLSPRHGAVHLIQAVYEGLAYETRLMLAACPRPPARLVVTGGLARHPEYMQILCDVCGLPLQVSPQTECALRGCALLALQAPAPQDEGLPHQPDSQAAAAYTGAYLERYLPLRCRVFQQENA
ncbi:MAG: L-fuculokinase [Christensenellales bacterium]